MTKGLIEKFELENVRTAINNVERSSSELATRVDKLDHRYQEDTMAYIDHAHALKKWKN